MILFGIAGWSGAGKTTLIEKLIPLLTKQGLRVSVIKHAHHHFDIDRPGKDSFRHREAGATEVLLQTSQRWVLMHELREDPEPTLAQQLSLLSPCDIVLIEGFKNEAVPKIEVYRPENGKPPLWKDNPHVVAIASTTPATHTLPHLPLDEPQAVVDFMLNYKAAR